MILLLRGEEEGRIGGRDEEGEGWMQWEGRLKEEEEGERGWR